MEMEQKYRWEKKLRQFPLFQDLDEELVHRLLAVMEIQEFEAGEYIIREGEEGKQMFLLLEGRVQVLKETLYKEEYVCAECGSEESYIFGEMAVLDKDVRSASIRTLTNSITGSISSDGFYNFCRENPAAGNGLILALTKKVCKNLRKSNQDLMIVFQALLDEVEES